MCVDPVTLAVTTTAISAAASAGGQIMAYNAQNQAALQNADAALASYRDQISQQQTKGEQVNAAASEDALSQAMAAATARSAGITDAAGRGLSTMSIADVVQGIDFQSGRNTSIAEANRKAQLDQIGAENRGIAAQAASRINSVPTGNRTALALGLIGTAAQAGASLAGAGVFGSPTGGAVKLAKGTLKASTVKPIKNITPLQIPIVR